MALELLPDTAYVVIASASVVDVEFDHLREWLGEAIDASSRRSTDGE